MLIVDSEKINRPVNLYQFLVVVLAPSHSMTRTFVPFTSPNYLLLSEVSILVV